MMRKGIQKLALATLLVGLAALCGCTRTVNRTAERKIRDVLPDLLGPARQYRAHIDSAPQRTMAGHVGTVTIDGDDVRLSTGLILDEIHLELKGVEVDTKAQRVRSVQEARFTATVGENSLNEFLAGEEPLGEKIQHLNLTLKPGRVKLEAERVVLGLGVPFSLTGPIRVKPPRSIELDPTRLTVIGIPISGKPLQFLIKRFENSIDLTGLPFPVQLTEVTTTSGKLNLTGTADVTELLRSAQANKTK